MLKVLGSHPAAVYWLLGFCATGLLWPACNWEHHGAVIAASPFSCHINKTCWQLAITAEDRWVRGSLDCGISPASLDRNTQWPRGQMHNSICNYIAQRQVCSNGWDSISEFLFKVKLCVNRTNTGRKNSFKLNFPKLRLFKYIQRIKCPPLIDLKHLTHQLQGHDTLNSWPVSTVFKIAHEGVSKFLYFHFILVTTTWWGLRPHLT